jgi:AcrR family transcriptional regulator
MESTAPPGRPRSDASRQAILSAAFAILAERGYAGLAIEGVAQRAGTAKTTVYRWWKSKAELAVDAFFHATKAAIELPDTGSIREDFRLQIIDLSALLAGPVGTVFAAMLGGARTDPELARALGERWLEPRRRWGFAKMMQAIKTGQTRQGIDPGAALGILYGPLYTPLLFGQPVPNAAQVEAHLSIALDAVFSYATRG